MGNTHDKMKWQRQPTAVWPTVNIGSKEIKCILFDIIAEFEEKNGRPPYRIEVAQIYMRESWRWKSKFKEHPILLLAGPKYFTCIVMNGMYRDDILYATDDVD